MSARVEAAGAVERPAEGGAVLAGRRAFRVRPVPERNVGPGDPRRAEPRERAPLAAAGGFSSSARRAGAHEGPHPAGSSPPTPRPGALPRLGASESSSGPPSERGDGSPTVRLTRLPRIRPGVAREPEDAGEWQLGGNPAAGPARRCPRFRSASGSAGLVSRRLRSGRSGGAEQWNPTWKDAA